MQMEEPASLEFQDPPPSGNNPSTSEGSLILPSTSNGLSEKLAKRPTRQWAAWTREEEESFFTALRLVGKNFEKITCRVQSKNKDQVRHYYYRLVRRMNKLLGPDVSLDAKNSKDTNSAMLRWWALLEKYSCKASKLHLKPRRFKIFIEALEHQLLKDRKKHVRRRPSQGGNCPSLPPTPAPQQSKPSVGETCAIKFVLVDNQNIQKGGGGKVPSVRRNPGTGINKNANKGDSSPIRASRQRRRSGGALSAAAIKKWEKAAIAGVSLVADAAEHLERTTFGKECEPSDALAHSSPQAAVCSKEETCLGPSKVVPPPFANFSSNVPPQSSEENAGKLKLQFFPIDEATKRALEMDKHNPYLELTLSTRKKITSVMEHLNKKWGNASVVCGELMLFPYSAQRENVLKYQRWTRESFVTAADVYEAIGKPPVFRLRYGWISPSELQSATSAAPLNMSDSHMRLRVDPTLLSGPWSNRLGKHGSLGERQQASSRHDNVVSQCMNGAPDGTTGCVGSDLENDLLDLSEIEASLLPQRSVSFSRTFDGEGAGNCSAFSAGVWADSLTNLSVGDLLTELSDEDADCVEAPLARSPPCLEETPFSCDSFDAAIAAHILSHQNNTGFQSALTSHSSSIWDAEETCDAFAFHKSALNNEMVQNSPPVCRDIIRTNSAGSDGFFEDSPNEEEMMNFAAQGGLMEENPIPSEPNLPENSSCNMNALTDLYWPESLGPLDLEAPCRYYSQDLILGDSHGGLSRLIANSLDAFQNCSFFSMEKKETPSATGAQGKTLS